MNEIHETEGADFRDLLSRRRRVLHQCMPPPFFPERDSANWICGDCETIWRWNHLGEWWEEEV